MFLKRPSLLALALFCTAAPAAADVPPPDACMTEGATCANAGGMANLPGVCRPSTCTRATPDGGVITYDCLRCQASGGNSGAGGSSAGKAGADAGAGGDDDGNCSCRLSSRATERGLAGLMLLLGAAALLQSRRRRG